MLLIRLIRPIGPIRRSVPRLDSPAPNSPPPRVGTRGYKNDALRARDEGLPTRSPTIGDGTGRGNARSNGETDPCNEAMHQYDEAMLRGNGALTRSNGPMDRCNGAMSQCSEAMDRYDGTMSRVNVPMSRGNDPMHRCNVTMSRSNEAMSRSNEAMHRYEEAMSRVNDPMSRCNVPMHRCSVTMFRSNEAISRSNEATSRVNEPSYPSQTLRTRPESQRTGPTALRAGSDTDDRLPLPPVLVRLKTGDGEVEVRTVRRGVARGADVAENLPSRDLLPLGEAGGVVVESA